MRFRFGGLGWSAVVCKGNHFVVARSEHGATIDLGIGGYMRGEALGATKSGGQTAG